jgi:hypothetical protein
MTDDDQPAKRTKPVDYLADVPIVTDPDGQAWVKGINGEWYPIRPNDLPPLKPLDERYKTGDP